MVVSKERIFLLIISFIYILVLRFTYEITIYPRWNYIGLGFSPPSLWMSEFSVLFAIIPLFWAPVSFFRPSVLLYYVQYTLVYVPTLYVCYHVNKPNLGDWECFTLNVFLFLGMLLLTIAYHIRIRKISPKFQLKQTYSLTYVGFSFSVILLFIVGLKTGSSFDSAFETDDTTRLVGAQIFENANASRGKFSSSASTLGGRFAVYSMFWLSGFFLPLIFTYGIFLRKKINFVFFFLGYLFLFIFAGYKACIVALVSLPITWYILSRKTNGPAVMILMCSFFLIISNLSSLAETGGTQIGAWFSMLTKWASFRIFCIAPLTIVQYLDFFESNPLTYMSHVKGFNLLIDYPYIQDIAKYVGRYYYGGGINVNAGLWATDGIAAFGIVGILISSIVCGVVFWVFDSAAIGFNPKFVSLASGYLSMTFANTSIFTNVLTGGLFLLILTVYFMPDAVKRKTWPKKFYKIEA